MFVPRTLYAQQASRSVARLFLTPARCQRSYRMAPTDSKPRPIVMSGPSGAGKSTIINRLQKEFPGQFGFSVSHTTRGPREGEINGVQYHFVTKEDFLSLEQEGGFIETAQFAGNYYGTSFKAVQDVVEKGQMCILDIEMEGVKQIKSHRSYDLNARFLFISPPSLEELRERLTKRNESAKRKDDIEARLKQAEKEMAYAETGAHDAVIVNDDLDTAYAEVKSYVISQSM